MIYPHYSGLPLIPSKSAMREMMRHGMDLYNVLKILEQGYDTGKRKTGIIEKCIDKQNKTVKVVIVSSYNYAMRSEVWVIIHVGMLKRKSRKR